MKYFSRELGEKQNQAPESLHRRSIRLPGYDYARAGAYCATICTQNRACAFGDIVDGKMRLSEVGTVVEECWKEIPEHFPAVALDAFIIMPNHLHGVLLIAEGRGTACRAPTTERFGKPVTHSIPTIIRSFKSAVTKRLHASPNPPSLSVWQRNYYERVIRDEEELHRIRQYIVDNPLHWALDRENPAIVKPTLPPKGSQTRPSVKTEGSRTTLLDDIGTIFEVGPS